MPLIAATNTNSVPFHTSMHWYLIVFTGENLLVFQSDPSCFQQALDEIQSRIDFRKILFSVGHFLLNSVICGFWKLIRKHIFYTLLNVLVHFFFYRVYIKFSTSSGLKFCKFCMFCSYLTLNNEVLNEVVLTYGKNNLIILLQNH